MSVSQQPLSSQTGSFVQKFPVALIELMNSRFVRAARDLDLAGLY